MNEYKFHGNKKLLIQKFKQYANKININNNINNGLKPLKK